MSNRTRSRFLKLGIVAGNAAVLVAVVALVATHFQDAKPATVVNQQSRLSSLIGGSSQANNLQAGPLDQVSSVDIAVAVARTANLPEQIAVSNQADSVNNTIVSTQVSSTAVANKPQIVATSFKSNKDIKTYVTKEGDTITSIATAFGVTSDSIRWSNDTNGDAVAVGRSLVIPPVTGIVYTVVDGDTPESLAQKYSADAQQIIAYNDAEIKGLTVGGRILIPNGKKPTPVVSLRSNNAGYSGGLAWGTRAIYGYNGYDPGWCTYYAASRVSIPANWGNANRWDNSARATPGWTVSSVPIPGAIAQTDRGSMGHVGIVEEVSEDGTMIKYSDMNGISGFGRVGYSGWVSASYYTNYIYR